MIRFTVLDRQPPPGPKARLVRRFIFNGGGGGGGGGAVTFTFTFTFSHLADAFIQSDLELGST